MNRDSLKYILKAVFAAVVFILIVDRAVYWGMTQISEKVTSGQAIGKLNYYLKNNKDYDVVILGSSRVSRHFVPEEIAENSFNMGMDGIRLGYSSVMLKLLPRDKEQTVIFHIDHGYAVDKEYTGSDIRALKPFYHKNEIIRQNIDNYNAAGFFDKFLYATDYNGKFLGIIVNYLRPNSEYTDGKGYEPNYIDPVQQENLQKEVIKLDAQSEDCNAPVQISKFYKNELAEIKKIAKDTRKNLVFVTSPRFSDKCKNDNRELKRVMDSLELVYIDDTDFFKNRNRLENWKDPAHLANEGAVAYSKHMKKALDSLKLGLITIKKKN